MAEHVDTPSDVLDALRVFHAGGGGRGATVQPGFIVLGYTHGSRNLLCVTTQGTGGVGEAIAAGAFPRDECRYALFRRAFRHELVSSAKFAYVDWTPEGDGVPPTVRALLSTHKSQVSRIAQPHHVSLQASAHADLSDAELDAQVARVSGVTSHELDRESALRAQADEQARAAVYAPATVAAARSALLPGSVRDVRSLAIVDEGAMRAAIAAVRNDVDPSDWMLITYATEALDSLRLAGAGAGGVDELARALDPARVQYGLFRVTERIDASETVKFGHIKVLCDHLPPVRKAHVATHQGFIKALFEPFHIDFAFDSPADVSLATVLTKIHANSGNVSRVTAGAPPPGTHTAGIGPGRGAPSAGGGGGAGGAAPASPATPGAMPSTSGFVLVLEDEAQLRGALRAVHHGEGGASWALLAYQRGPPDAVRLVARGADADPAAALVGAAEALGSDAVAFGIVRVTEQVDRSVTTKFASVKWQRDGAPAMLKARVGTLKGRIDELFQPVHVDFFVSSAAEFTLAAVLEKVGRASGTKAGVRSPGL